MGIAEWGEKGQACVRPRHLPAAEQAEFTFDHLEEDAEEQIKFRPREEQLDPVRVFAISKEL